ncbi:cell division protein DedD, partial [Vibrio sp. Vb2880]|nr:cell division protein DedD [Vibrio sp. Vb2880]
MISKWAKRLYQMAELVASWSKDPSTQVGAVITKQNRIVSVGFNGYPHGVSDS